MIGDLVRLLRTLVQQHKLYYIWIVMVSAVLLMVWIHAVSAVGARIELFWGLASYIKAPFPWNWCGSEPVPSIPPLRIASSGQPATARALSEFRAQAHLRDLSTMEVGKPLGDMPVGAYGYVSGLRVDPKVRRLVAEDAVERGDRPKGTKFEVQKNRDGAISVIAYLPVSESARMLARSPEYQEITLFPKPLNGQCDLLLIPETAFLDAGMRTLRVEHKSKQVEEVRVIDAKLNFGAR